MKVIIIAFLVVTILISAMPTVAEEGRYQAIRMDATSVFIIDTQEGHLWTWGVATGGTMLIYLGQLRPGKKMGDLIGSFTPKEVKK